MKKLKLILLAAVLAFGTQLVHAQTGAHDKGKHFLEPGIDLGWGLGLPSFSWDMGLHKDWSIGLGTAFTWWDGGFGTYIVVRGDYHFGTLLKMPEKMDWYAGLDLGPAFGFGNGVGFNFRGGINTGYRYFFTEKIGITVALHGGYAYSHLKVAATFKI
jgi:hypothetical protein